MFSSVVLPAPVPPDTRIFSRARTIASKTFAISSVSDLLATRFSIRSGSIPSAGWRAPARPAPAGDDDVHAGAIGQPASTRGVDSSTRRPTLETIRSMIVIRWSSSLKVTSVLCSFRASRCKHSRSVDHDVGDLRILEQRLQGPSPRVSCWISRTSRLPLYRVSGIPSAVMSPSTTVLMIPRVAPGRSRRRRRGPDGRSIFGGCCF